MTNLQLLISVAMPSLLVLINIMLGTWAIKELRAEIKDVLGEIKDVRGEIKDLRSEMIVRLDRVDADLRTFYSITGRLEGRLDTLEKR
jgi:hypothetical protein